MKKWFVAVLAVCLLLVGCSKAQPESAVIPEAEAAVCTIRPLPDTTMNDRNHAVLAAAFDEEDVYVDDKGVLQMHLEIYTYDQYDMVDIANLKVGDILSRSSGEMEITSLERADDGSVQINGGIDADGCWLVSDDDGVFYEMEYNDSKNWHKVGEATFPVSADFELVDSSDLELGEVVFYAGSFLTEEIPYFDFTANNTTVRIADGQIVAMERVYTP